MHAGENRLEALGAVRLTAIVADEVPAAAALWEAVGYERQQSTSRYVRMVGASTTDNAPQGRRGVIRGYCREGGVVTEFWGKGDERLSGGYP